MGDLIPRKNYRSSIAALAQTKNSKIHLLICGKGPDLRSLKDLAVELNVREQVHFLGFRRDIRQLLDLSDIFLFTTYQEGLPRSMMEAMSAGLPCIASNVRGNVDLVKDGEGGFLLHPDDVEGLAIAINTLAADKDLQRRMGLINLERIKPYDIDNVKEEILTIYGRELQ
jgi:glycosyltransferase involved in cell wall biosynthesis